MLRAPASLLWPYNRKSVALPRHSLLSSVRHPRPYQIAFDVTKKPLSNTTTSKHIVDAEKVTKSMLALIKERNYANALNGFELDSSPCLDCILNDTGNKMHITIELTMSLRKSKTPQQRSQEEEERLFPPVLSFLGQ